MKKLFIIFTLCLICIASFGQERVNRPKLHFISEGPILTDFTGWSYNNTSGEWIEHHNVISSSTSTYISNSHYKNNIISLQVKTIIYKDTRYYVLIWYKYDGYYEYEYIYEGWTPYEIKNYLMITEDKMESLRNLTNTPITLYFPTPTKLDVETTADVDIIQTSMDREYILNTGLIIYKATDGSIRFLFKSILDEDISQEYFEISEADYLRLIDVHFNE
jgi:hypothetical protein